MKREVNPRLSYKRNTIQILSELSKAVGIEKKSESEDPLHKWIASYNLRLVVFTRFYRWLYYPNIEDPKRRSELFKLSPEMTIETDLENKWITTKHI
jgi:hypothetical protein